MNADAGGKSTFTLPFASRRAARHMMLIRVTWTGGNNRQNSIRTYYNYQYIIEISADLLCAAWNALRHSIMGLKVFEDHTRH